MKAFFIVLVASVSLLTSASLLHAQDASVGEIYQRSYDHEATQQYDAALVGLEKMPAAEKASYPYLLRRAWLLYTNGRHAEAVAAYDAAIAKAPDGIEAQLGKTLPLMALRRWADVEKAARKVLASSPHHYLAESRLAWALYNLGRFSEALDAYKALAALYPADVEMQAGVGWALLKLGRKADAAASFRRVLELAPRHPTAREGLALTGL